jgi:hypothetical protein
MAAAQAAAEKALQALQELQGQLVHQELQVHQALQEQQEQQALQDQPVPQELQVLQATS